MTKDKILISQLDKAESFIDRGLGLIPRKSLSAEEGLWIGQCKTIHTFFMSFAIDCVFVDKNMKVTGLVESIKPWRLSAFFWKADSVIELTAGSIQRLGIEVGEQLHVGH